MTNRCPVVSMVSLGSLALRELLWEEAAPLLDPAELDLAMLSCTLPHSSTPFPLLLLLIPYCMCFMLRCIDLPSTWLFTTVISKRKFRVWYLARANQNVRSCTNILLDRWATIYMKITLFILIAKKFTLSCTPPNMKQSSEFWDTPWIWVTASFPNGV